MKRLLLVLAAVASQAQTVSNITFDGIGDSSARVIFNWTGTATEFQTRYRKVSDGACSAGQTGATVLIQPSNSGQNVAPFPKYGMTTVLSGMTPGTPYNVCAEARNGVGAWSTGATAVLTTLARSSSTTDPVAPEAVSMTYPAQSGTTYTVPAGGCQNALTGLQAYLNRAEAGTINWGDTILVPAGTICNPITLPSAPLSTRHLLLTSEVVTSTSTITWTGHGLADNDEIQFSAGAANTNCLPGLVIYSNGVPGQQSGTCEKSGNGWVKHKKFYCDRVDANHCIVIDAPNGNKVIPGWITFLPANVDPSLGVETITFYPTMDTPGGYTTAAGGIPANTPIQLIATGGSLPGGLFVDTTYFMLDPCTASATAPCVTRLAATSGGAAINITSTGSGVFTIVDRGSGTMWVTKAPQHSDPWLLIKTTGALPTAGVRVTTADDSQMFEIRSTARTFNTPILSANSRDSIFTHNIRFEGVLMSTDAVSSDTDYLNTIDPRGYCVGLDSGVDTHHIVIDRSHIQAATSPHRTGCRTGGANMFLDGAYVAITNSLLDRFDFPHSWSGTLADGQAGGTGITLARVNNTQATVSAGVVYQIGGVRTTLTSMTINITNGAGTGTAGKVSVALDGTFKVLLPTGVTGNCSIAGSITPSGSLTCTISNTTTPDWLTTSLGGASRRTEFAVGSLNFTTGNLSSVTPESKISYSLEGAIEGCNCIIAGNGPGPYLFYNNRVEGSGLTIHFDDSSSTFQHKHDFTIQRNSFLVNPATVFISGASWDGLWYGNRQPLEWKDGQRIEITGNYFQDCAANWGNGNGVCVVMTARTGGYITDVNMHHNQFYNVDGMTSVAFNPDTYAPVSKPAARQRFTHNLAMISAYDHYATGEVFPLGFSFYGGNATENIFIDHNTFFDSRGVAPNILHWDWAPMGGFTFSNNIWFYTANSYAFIISSSPVICMSTADKAYLDACATPTYVMNKNAIIPSWTDFTNPAAPTGQGDSATLAARFGAPLSNFFGQVGGISVPNQVLYVNWACGSITLCRSPTADFTLNGSSPYHLAGSDGADIGVDFVALTTALTGTNGGSTNKPRVKSTFRQGRGRK